MENKTISILYVEDHKNISKDISSLLEKRGYIVYSAYDGEEALDLYFKFLPNIILTDLKMPKLSGLNLIEKIRKFDNKTPIIVLSAVDEIDYLKECIRLNVDTYLKKPIKFEELFNAIDTIKKSLKIINQNELLINRLKKDKRKYKELMTLSSESIYITDLDANIIEYSVASQRQLGYTDKEMALLSFHDIDSTHSVTQLKKVFSLFKEEPIEFETVHTRKDGTSFTVSVRACKIDIDNESYVYAVARDMSEYKKIYNRLQKLLDTQNNILILTDGYDIQYANRSLLEFFGYETLIDFKKEIQCLCNKFVENNRYFHIPPNTKDMVWIDEILKLPSEKRMVAMVDNNFEVHVFTVDINKFDTESTLVSFTDMSQNMLKTLELEDKVIHDKLTGAFNREYFEHNIPTIIKTLERNSRLAICYMDIDHFKNVNDQYGHDIGDIVLKELVKIVQNFSRQEDTLIRFGGEEFVIVLKVNNIDGAIKAVDNFRHIIEAHTFEAVKKVTCSFGVTLYETGENIDITLKRADNALYEAKESGRNKVCSS